MSRNDNDADDNTTKFLHIFTKNILKFDVLLLYVLQYPKSWSYFKTLISIIVKNHIIESHNNLLKNANPGFYFFRC